MPHEVYNRKADSVNAPALYPIFYQGQKRRAVFLKASGRALVASGPVVDERQKALQLGDALVKVLYAAYDKGMQLVFFKILVRKVGKEFLRGAFWAFQKFLGQSAQFRRLYAKNAFGVNVGNCFCVKSGGLWVGHLPQRFCD